MDNEKEAVAVSKRDMWHNGEEEERRYPDFIRESQAAYKASANPVLAQLLAKTQGEYTVEDYCALPEDCRVELIDGVIYNMSAPGKLHQVLAFRIAVQLDEWIRKKKGSCIVIMSPCDVQLDKNDKTMVQPDVFVVCKKEEKESDAEDEREATRNMNAHVFCGAPDLVVEVLSPSSEIKDRIIKYKKYKNAGVREYWIVDPDAEVITVHWFGEGAETKMYTYQDGIPVYIFGGACKVLLKDIPQSKALLIEMGMLK